MMSLRNKLWSAFASLALILLAVSALSVLVFTRYSHALERVFRENYDSAGYIQTMQQAMQRLDARAQRMMWDRPDAIPAGERAEAQEQFDRALRSQLGNCNLPGETEATARVAATWRQYRAQYDAFDAAPPAERPARYRRDLRPLHDELTRVAQRVADMNTSAMVSVDGQAKRTLLNVRNALLVLVAVGVALAAVVLWTATLTIFRPLGDLTASARQIEKGNLDLNLSAPGGRRDEIGRLTDAFNSMAARLREFKRLDHDRLTRSQQTTQLAIDSLADAVLVIGPDARVEICNAAARAYFGIEPGRLVNSFGLNWLPPLYDRVVAEGQPSNPEGYRAAVQLFVSGEERFLLPKAMPMRMPDGRQVGVAVILVDVTQLRRVDEAKSNLVSTVAHELRTPLTSQRLVLGLLLDTVGPTLPSNQRRMLEVAKADGDRLYRTIEDLLSISRMESGRLSFQFQATDVAEFIRAAVEPLRPLAADKLLSFTVDVPSDLPSMRADPAALAPALANLLSNAVKFTPPAGAIRVAATAADGVVIFTVADTGPGIAPEFRERVFDKFFRVPNVSAPPGAGLGLAIAKQLVEAHGGRIQLDPHNGTGASFRFSIPCWK